jgi:ubiquinone/menaquinone biosynthesis C-methylase UbiE
VWNRVRYTLWAPLYDRVATSVAGFDAARRRSIERLKLRPGDRVLIAGAGTGLDLPCFPPGVHLTAVDVTPAMLGRLRDRAAALGLDVDARVMDARHLAFHDASFDAVVLHLVLAVMPEPERGLLEAARVVKTGGRIGVFDKFLPRGRALTLRRRLLNLPARLLCTDMNRRLEPMVERAALAVEFDEPVAFGGLYRIVTLRRD